MIIIYNIKSLKKDLVKPSLEMQYDLPVYIIFCIYVMDHVWFWPDSSAIFVLFKVLSLNPRWVMYFFLDCTFLGSMLEL